MKASVAWATGLDPVATMSLSLQGVARLQTFY